MIDVFANATCVVKNGHVGTIYCSADEYYFAINTLALLDIDFSIVFFFISVESIYNQAYLFREDSPFPLLKKFGGKAKDYSPRALFRHYILRYGTNTLAEHE